ncbi:MAG: MBL fold metallo-hydrolase [Bacteroidota bacterium]
MKLTFWGAARQVTGSMHLLTLDNNYNILVDCGLNYENKKTFDEDNSQFPFYPESIDLVILTHAHIDHSGNLPNLVKQGFKGQILCTDASVELTKNLLLDSMNVQMIESNKKRNVRKGGKKKAKFSRSQGYNEAQVLYNRKHVEHTVDAMVGIGFRLPFVVNESLTIEFFEAGHILGAASVKMTINENGKTKTIGFTGDLGNYSSKLVKDPQPMPGLEYLVSESTYGGRLHTDVADAETLLLAYVTNTCVKYNGKLVIPAFSVGRTQAIIFAFHQLHIKGLLPPQVRIYSDSPLAIRTTKLYDQYIGSLNDEAQAFYMQHGHLFAFPQLTTIEESKESEIISMSPEPAVIISAAGMVEGGRIQEHVRNNIGNPYSTILIAGFCAPGTLGHELLQGRPSVNINKRERQVYAKIARTDAFSAHPDQNGLMRYFESIHYKKLKKIFLVHGDEDSMMKFKEHINLPTVETPFEGQTFEL